MNRPTASVLMALYNCEPFVEQAIRSVLSQSLGDLELIVVDDGSTDRSLEIARSFSDGRLRVVSVTPNRGISATRNHALAEAHGRYLAWLDSDDVALPCRIERQVQVFESRPEIGLCHSNFSEIDSNGLVTKSAWNKDDGLPTEWKLVWTNPIAQSTVMVRRSVLPSGAQLYDPRRDPAEDYDLWTRLVRGSRFHYCNEVLVHYRNLSTSAFHTRPQKALKESIESNRLLVEALTGERVPPFHALLTSFGGVLGQDLRADYFEIERWYERLSSLLASRQNWDSATRARVEESIQRRLLAHLRGDAGVFFSKGTSRKLFARNPLLVVSLGLLWALRFLRTLARKVLKEPVMKLRKRS